MTVAHLYKKIIVVIAVIACCANAFSQKTIPGLRSSLESATTNEAKADICYDIADLYAVLLKIDSAIYFSNKVKEYSGQANYETGIGKYYLAFAYAIAFRRKDEESATNAAKAIEIFTRQKETNLLGRAYLVLANAQYSVNDIPLATKNYWAAINCYERISNTKGLYTAYARLARSYFKTSQIDSVSFYYLKALAIAEQLNDPEKIYESACWVGRTFLSLGEPDNAIKYLEYGLKNRIPKLDKVGIRSFLTDYATGLVATHQFDRADSVIGEIASLNAIFKDDYGSVLFNGLKGTLEYEKKNYPEAVFYLRQACDKRNELELTNNETKDILLLLGKAEYETKNYDSAIHHLQLAAGITGGLRDMFEEEEANLLISRYFQQKGNADSALHYFKKYTVLKDSILSQQKQKNIIEVTTRYETTKREQEIKILEKEKQANSYLLQMQNQQIEKQKLEGEKKSQQLQLLSQQSEISRLEASQKTLALQNQEKEILKKQQELELASKENQLTATIATKEGQKKKIAYVAALAILIVGGIAFIKYRQSRKLSRQLSVSLTSLKEAQEQLVKTEKEKESENVRVRISRDIHDEVGATLSGVALYSEIAKQKMEEHQEKDAQVYLDHISVNSKEMVEKMSDIVWAINPDNDSFERIIAKLQSYAFNLCAGKGIALHLNIDDAMRKDYPTMQVRRNLYLFMKEAVNNAVKYSGAKNLYLSLLEKNNSIIAEIKDDGNGFDASVNYMGNGLKNMKARADSLEGDFVIDSKAGKGTSIRVQFQFHPSGGQSQKA